MTVAYKGAWLVYNPNPAHRPTTLRWPNSIMESAGMMKMATSEGSPLRQGAEIGSRLVFGGYRGLRRWNSRSRFCSGIFWVRRYIWVQGVHRWTSGVLTRQVGAPRGGGDPHPRGQPRTPLMCTPSLSGCFPSKNNFSS